MQPRDRFFLWTAVAIAATVLGGFWFTYFGPIIAGERERNVIAVHLHGWSFFAWYALLVVQSALVQSRRVALHRTLGGASLALATVMVATGTLVVGVRMADAAVTGDPFWSASGPAVFITLLLFAGFYVAALRLRRRADWHRRLMIVASVGGMGAATFRLVMVFIGPEYAMWLGLIGSNAFLVAGVVHDAIREKRVHPAWWIGLGSCLVLEVGVMSLAPTAPVQLLARALAAVGRVFGFLY